MSTWSNASRKQEGRSSGSWLANWLWVSLDVRPYLLLFGDTLIRPLFSFWWFISICSGPQAENSTLKVKKVGYYPTIDKTISICYSLKINKILECLLHGNHNNILMQRLNGDTTNLLNLYYIWNFLNTYDIWSIYMISTMHIWGNCETERLFHNAK